MSPHRPSLAAGVPEAGTLRRSLILAGGGMRVSYQAGVLLALAEHGLRFHHADGTSGGTINLAMLLSGLSPREMCDRWRALPVHDFVSLLPLPEYFEHLQQIALGDGRGVLEKVFPQLGIDAEKIRAAQGMDGTFNVCNFTRKRNQAVAHTAVDVRHLLAGISLPIFMPPVEIDDCLYTDSVWIKDANLMEAVRRGAEEIWLVWCIGNSAPYRPGAFNQYVHMIEMSANGVLFEEFDAINDLNQRIARGESAFGQTRPIRLHVIKPEWPLPLDPELYLNRIDNPTLIDMGYADACRYLTGMRDEGVLLSPDATHMRTPMPGVMFRETWHGILSSEDAAAAGPLTAGEIRVHAAVNIRDAAAFVAASPRYGDLYAHIECASEASPIIARGGKFTCETDADDPRLDTRMRRLHYELIFDWAGETYRLTAIRELDVRSSLQLFKEVAEVRISLHRGMDEAAPKVAHGMLNVCFADRWHTAASVSVTNVDAPMTSVQVLAEFGKFMYGLE